MKDYKKILEGIVDIIKTTEKSDIGFANICSYIGENCPELAQSELLDKKVTELNLSVRTTNICLSNGLNTVRDICRISRTDWMKFRHGGHKSMREIDDYLKDNGLDWGMNV
jgi:DNA-directed RNA polymerase alpha subunit